MTCPIQNENVCYHERSVNDSGIILQVSRWILNLALLSKGRTIPDGRVRSAKIGSPFAWTSTSSG
jgi:hypothetical protein